MEPKPQTKILILFISKLQDVTSFYRVCPERANYTFYETFRILSKTGFLSCNFGSRYASKSIKGSKDADFDLVSKTTLSQKMAHWIGAQGQVKLSKNVKTSPHYDITPRKPQIQNEKKLFSISTRRLAESVECLNISLVQSAGEL